ncbi:AraC family transcriptional regulator [Roseateles sp. LYH14W]|uniref:AraC family transcriptional regulator n=1 Tax=Pelomonas parva TaxID=3299032 RepID=A0ABW7F114_9BURK
MSDPLTQVVQLLQPRAVFANLISGKGAWAVRFAEYGRPSFCIMLAGQCRLAVDGHEPVTFAAGDFVLLPATPAFTISSAEPAMPVHIDPHSIGGQGEVRYGAPGGEPDMLSLGGAFLFDADDTSLLVALLPRVVHVQGSARLAQLVRMVGEEYEQQLPGSEFMRAQLVALMLVEAMRSTTGGSAPPGLMRGLGDERVAAALQQIHAQPEHAWTGEQLAAVAALSRSAFFDRFTRKVGVAPMEYLLRWRMQLAKGLLRDGGLGIAAVAERVGYSSTSTFSTAFRRHMGQAPRQFMRGPDLPP